jgi:hypothetical protein
MRLKESMWELTVLNTSVAVTSKGTGCKQTRQYPCRIRHSAAPYIAIGVWTLTVIVLLGTAALYTLHWVEPSQGDFMYPVKDKVQKVCYISAVDSL